MLRYIERIKDRTYAIDEEAGFYTFHCHWDGVTHTCPVASIKDGIDLISLFHPPWMLKRRLIYAVAHTMILWSTVTTLFVKFDGGSTVVGIWTMLLVLGAQGVGRTPSFNAWLCDVPVERFTRKSMFPEKPDGRTDRVLDPSDSF